MSEGIDQGLITSHRECRVCGAALWHRNRTGLCRRHAALDPELQARRAGDAAVKMKRAAATRLALAAKPEIREKQRRRSAEFNRSPEMRAKSREIAKRLTPHDRRKGHGPESYRKQNIARIETVLAKVPRDQRPLYLHLTRVKRLPAAEALAIVTSHEAAQLERFRRELEGAGQ